MVERRLDPVFHCLTISLLLFGCAAPQTATQTTKATFASYASMAPSNTELLYAIGAQDHLVGVCTQCDHPADAKSLPKLGNFVTADLEKLATVRPEAVFVVDGQELMASTIDKQLAFKTHTEILHNRNIDDIAENVNKLGKMTAHERAATELASQFRKSVEDLRSAVGKSASKPKVFYCAWPEPLIAVGKDSYLNDAITISGGTNICGNMPGGYPRYNIEKLMVEQPDVIIMPTEVTPDSLNRAPWTSLQAVKNKRIHFLPARNSDTLSRPTLRTLDGLYWLAERIHPELATQLSMSKNSIRHLPSTTAENR